MTVAVPYFSFPGFHAAARRFALALAASAVAHLFLVQFLVFDLPQRAARPMHAGTITVRLELPTPPRAAIPVPSLVAPRIGLGATADAYGHPVAPAAIGARPQQSAVAALALPQAPDPTYYSARELDVYPRPAAPFDFDRLGPRVTGSTPGKLRVILLIDESGAVNEIAVIEAEPPGRMQEELRAALAATRFSPGQKDGRAVKSRVLLSVSFDPVRAGSGGP